MRIGLVTDFYYPWIAGPSAAIRTLADGLSRRGHQVYLLAPSPTGSAYQEVEQRVEITRAQTRQVPFGYQLRAALPPTAVGAWLESARPDVVHIHHPFPLSARAVYCSQRAGIPVVATNHTIPSCSLWGIRGWGPAYSLAHSAFARWIVALLNRCDAAATPTATAARLLAELGYGGPVEVISNGLDTRAFRPGPPNRALAASLGFDERPIVLYTGRLDAEKDMATWLRAAARVASVADVQFGVGGEGTDRARLQELANSLGIGERTRFFGYVRLEDLPHLYRLASLYFITSAVELQSITTLEAAATGLPVVAARSAALPELVRPGGNGFLVEPGADAEAAAAISRILADNQTRANMARESRAVALGHDSERTVDRYEALYGRVLSRRDQVSERAASAG